MFHQSLEKNNFLDPFPHVVIFSFLKEEFFRDLQKEFSQISFESKNSDLFSFKQSKDLSSFDGLLGDFFSFLSSENFKKFVSDLFNIDLKGRVDCSAFCYSSGDYLLPHDDRSDGWRVAFAFYLGEDFFEEDGGQLDFFESGSLSKSILPKENSLVFFLVEEGKSIHQVREILSDKKRLSFAGWFYD